MWVLLHQLWYHGNCNLTNPLTPSAARNFNTVPGFLEPLCCTPVYGRIACHIELPPTCSSDPCHIGFDILLPQGLHGHGIALYLWSHMRHNNMPHRLRRHQQRLYLRRRIRNRRALRNQRLRRNRRRNRFYGPARRTLLYERCLPVYTLNELRAPPVPPVITRTEFNQAIAHTVERNSWSYHLCWSNAREVTGDIMEYQFRLRFPIPVHLPRAAMKTVLLFLADEDSVDDVWGHDGLWLTPTEYTFQWPRPFFWP